MLGLPEIGGLYMDGRSAASMRVGRTQILHARSQIN